MLMRAPKYISLTKNSSKEYHCRDISITRANRNRRRRNKKTELKFLEEEDNANDNKKPVTKGIGIPYQTDNQLHITPANKLQDQSNPTHEITYAEGRLTKEWLGFEI